MKRIIFLFMVSVFIFSCSNNNYPVVTYKEDNNTVTRSIESKVEVVSISYHSIKITEPTKPELMQKINNDVNSFLLSKVYTNGYYENLDQMADSLLYNYNSLLSDFPNIPYIYEVERNVKVELDTLGIFSFSKSEYTYLGGAHPNSATQFSNYDIQTNSAIELDDLFVKDYKKKLNEIGEIIFRRNYNLTQDQNLDEAGFWFEDSIFKLNDNYLLTLDGIEFYYNAYEIAPYAMGPISLLLPYKEISDLINENSPIAVFVK